MQSFNNLNIKKTLRYMDFLKNSSPRHRFRFSQQAWLPQDKTADPVLRRLHERLFLPNTNNNKYNNNKVTRARCPVDKRGCHNLQQRFPACNWLRDKLQIRKCHMLYCDLKPTCFVLQDHKVNQAAEKNSSGWRTNAGERLNLKCARTCYTLTCKCNVLTWCKRNTLL